LRLANPTGDGRREDYVVRFERAKSSMWFVTARVNSYREQKEIIKINLE
jgi:hypothetical protein